MCFSCEPVDVLIWIALFMQMCTLLPENKGPWWKISRSSIGSYFNLQKSVLLNSNQDVYVGCISRLVCKFSGQTQNRWYSWVECTIKVFLFRDCDLHYERECDAQMSIWPVLPKKKKGGAAVHCDVNTFKSTGLCGWITVSR